MRARVLAWVLVAWHLLVLLSLAYAVGALRPSRMLFWRPSAWQPATSWLRTGYFFRFVTGRAAVTFFLVALVAGVLVLVVYLLDRRIGWMAMLAWNTLGALNYLPHLARPGRQELAAVLCLAFLAAACCTVASRPRAYGG